MKNYDAVWEAILSLVKEQTTPVCYDTWFRTPLKISSIDNELSIVYLDVTTSMDIDFFVDIINNRYLNLLQESFQEVLGSPYRVVINDPLKKRSEEKEGIKASPVKKSKKPSSTLLKENYLNPKYTFDNFVVGPSNRFAHAASLAVAESPGLASNPLFIYGGSGLGKTHLIQAIGIYILENNPNTKVLYTDSENFTNEFIQAIRDKKINEFKSKYRKVDVLIVDDVQFLEKKDSIQEEFFHTFTALFQKNKQIILTSDRAPNKLNNVDERLISRFQWNLMADIQPADYETRVAILLKFAENMNMEVDEDLREVIYLIAEKIKDNIRELEGAFTRIKFFAERTDEKPNKSFAKRILKDILANNEISVTPEKIKKAVSNYYNIKITDMESTKRTNSIAFPRQVAMYLIREMTDSSLPKIGEMFGGKDHTTVKYACDKIGDEIKRDENFRLIIENLMSEIKD